MPAESGIVKTVMNKMIVRLSGNPPTVVDWVLIDKKGASFKAFNEKIINQTDIVVLVPGVDVFLTEVSLPKLTAEQLTKAIPFALEELLADKKENIHFCSGEERENGSLPVAVVSKSKMEAWQSCLKIFFRMQSAYVHRYIPEMLALPWRSGTWTVFVDGEIAHIKTDRQSGFSLECDEFWTLFNIISKQKNRSLPESVRIVGKLSIPKVQAELLSAQGIQYTEEPWQALLSPTYSDDIKLDGINLLRGPYQQNIIMHTVKKFYFSSIILLLTFLAFSFGSILQYIMLKYQQHVWEKFSTEIYLHYFPAENKMDYKSITKRIQQAARNQRKAGFITMLNDVSPLFKNYPGIEIVRIDYVDRRLIIHISASDFELINKLSESLKLRKYSVHLYRGINTGGQMLARLMIEE